MLIGVGGGGDCIQALDVAGEIYAFFSSSPRKSGVGRDERELLISKREKKKECILSLVFPVECYKILYPSPHTNTQMVIQIQSKKIAVQAVGGGGGGLT